MEVTVGGDRLGAGKKNKAWLHNYNRSTHDLSYVWRSTMASGTLVPFLSELGLPGDTFDIDLDVDVLTHPTIGPLFGSYKIQLDCFMVPIRLYQAKLHMNMLGIGMDMSQVLLPQMRVFAPLVNVSKVIDNQHINPSSLLAYLGVRGVGHGTDTDGTGYLSREFNAIPYLAYWDIYKNYYANKQEEIGALITKDLAPPSIVLSAATVYFSGQNAVLNTTPPPGTTPVIAYLTPDSYIVLTGTGLSNNFDPAQILFTLKEFVTGNTIIVRGSTLFKNWVFQNNSLIGTIAPADGEPHRVIQSLLVSYDNSQNNVPAIQAPQITTFPLKNIDDMRTLILQHNVPQAFGLSYTSIAPYNEVFKIGGASPQVTASQFPQVGLALKTYQSDLFNNWISTEWIDGPDGISEITAVDTSSGKFTIDELNLSRKVYDMLNRIALSGGSYDDWLDAVYTHERTRSAENPMYVGGLQTRLVFQEVVSNASSDGQPLGSLAGRGKVNHNAKKGGHVIIKCDEPCYIMGIVSLTPYVDYSQGNKWDTRLKTMNDFHKPALDQIGFQDLVTDQIAWWDTLVTFTPDAITTKSAGKQPAWINYMTNINRVYGNFADQTQQMFMVLNRRYDLKMDGTTPTIADLTTYIDPSKFNHIFADTSLDAQNFWVQIACGMTARRKMSAKIMPNL